MQPAQKFPVADIYVPQKRRKSLNAETVESLAESMIEEGQKSPILVRNDGKRIILVEGLHRLEAMRALGEQHIDAIVVQARRH